MAFRVYIIFVFAALVVFGFAIPGPLRDRFDNDSDNIDISVTENEELLRLEARYPKNRSMRMHAYIKNYFSITDITDLDGVEVNPYTTADKSMRFHLKTRNGYLKIAMKKGENSTEALEKLRGAVDGIKQIITNETHYP